MFHIVDRRQQRAKIKKDPVDIYVVSTSFKFQNRHHLEGKDRVSNFIAQTVEKVPQHAT
jgi:hypothetical protein